MTAYCLLLHETSENVCIERGEVKYGKLQYRPRKLLFVSPTFGRSSWHQITRPNRPRKHLFPSLSSRTAFLTDWVERDHLIQHPELRPKPLCRSVIRSSWAHLYKRECQNCSMEIRLNRRRLVYLSLVAGPDLGYLGRRGKHYGGQFYLSKAIVCKLWWSEWY